MILYFQSYITNLMINPEYPKHLLSAGIHPGPRHLDRPKPGPYRETSAEGWEPAVADQLVLRLDLSRS